MRVAEVPMLAELRIGDAPERWQALGFTVAGEACDIGGVRLRLGGEGSGIRSWSVTGIAESVCEIDGLATAPSASASAGPGDPHPNGATGIDHVVIFTPDFERTSAALEGVGMPLRRIREVNGTFRQGFRRIGPAILEVVEARDEAAGGPARFWGLVVIVEDLDTLARRLGEQLGPIRPAVQPGRRIATLNAIAGLTPAVAFMDPES